MPSARANVAGRGSDFAIDRHDLRVRIQLHKLHDLNHSSIVCSCAYGAGRPSILAGNSGCRRIGLRHCCDLGRDLYPDRVDVPGGYRDGRLVLPPEPTRNN